MNRERIKSFILTGLVLMSIVLTIQLWLDVPIERLTSFSGSTQRQVSEKDYDLSNFVLPRWITVNFGGRSHTRLFRDSDTFRYYYEIYKEALNIFKRFSSGDQKVVLIKAAENEWVDAKFSKSVELEFERSLITPIIQKVFNTEPNLDLTLLSSVESIIITVGTDSNILIKDGGHGVIYKTVLSGASDRLAQLINQLEEKDPVKYWTIQEIGFVDNTNVYLPLDMSSFHLPVGTVEQEIDIFNQQVIEMYASGFFKDMSIVRKITETSGSVIFTDGSSALKINTNGYIEYLVYSANGSGKELTDPDEALDTALRFIDSHGGIPEQLYLRQVEEITENHHSGYLFKFNYCYNGLPVVFSGNSDLSAIEISVFNNSVVGYKRLIHRIIKFAIVQKPILSPIEIFNIMFAEGNYGSAQARPEILDMHLSYYIKPQDKKEYEVVPIWQIKRDDKTYIIDVYQGKILN